ncbi:MAG: tRNA pseudouridine(38-40) synthase TruA [Actinomycetia bacterium]|nr:tRNA pseudouridine(38-40) synthase TruA [Actinomycetes bacterium]
MVNYRAVVEYDGTEYCGFQIQPEGVATIQGCIQQAIAAVTGNEVSIKYAGRTDAGVHALHQVINFKLGSHQDIGRFKWSLNCVLPHDISIMDISPAEDEFDARRDAVRRQYSYYVVNDRVQSVFLKRYSIMVTQKLDLDLMKKAAGLLQGKKDFKAFGNQGEYGSTIRIIYGLDIIRNIDNLIIFRIEGSSFLYNMVRIIVGTLLELGKGLRSLESIHKALEARERELAGKTAPAKGLFLTKVLY